ncbi:MFS transporter [Pantoea sp. BAV 3049]|uniref:MFS transporter n=1 Tax=Pantoea sp. BAV 3049 TaxID=2654188 RepID=UPI00131B0D7C|nr:MFS transporter [Pantoea sp. BAV 3049]
MALVCRPRHALHFAPFRNLFLARILTVTGNAIAPVALAFSVLDIGGSAADLGMVVASRSVFNVAFLLLGGVLGDRYSRNKVLLCSSLIAALSQGMVAWLVLSDTATLTGLMMLGTVNGAAAGVALPASSALVPQTLPAQYLRQGNAFIQLGVYVGTVAGASLGGVLVGAIGPGWGLTVDALGFAASAPLYFCVRICAAQASGPHAHILQDLREGWKEFTARAWVWSVVVQFTIVNAVFSGVVMVLGPIVADASIGRTGWGMSIAAQSMGLIAGSFIALRWRPRRDMLAGVILVALCAVPVFLLGMGTSTLLLMGAFFLAGVGFGQFGVIWAHYLQTYIPADKLARVYAWDAMGSFVAIPFGELAAGPLALHFGSKPLLLACAAAVVAATVATSFVPAIRKFNSAPQRLP